jgi:hypothetical protein
MDIIQRNLFRLLRSGAFHSAEEIEPMSVFKWGRLYQLSVMHTVIPYVYEGINRCRSQFFLHLSAKQEEEWRQALREYQAQAEQQSDEIEEDELLRPDRLTNPLLNHRLQDILDDEHSDITTRQLLLIIIRIVRHLFNEGMPIRQLTELGIFLRKNQDRIDYVTLGKWIEQLHLTQMIQLICEFLIKMYGFTEDEIPFLQKRREKPIEQIAQELIEFTNTRSQNWYFSQQDGGIFVHNSNSSATFSHVRRSARYFRYYPSESVTNFFSSFVHSLSHIEE